MAEMAYGSQSLRHCGDLDILVSWNDVPKAADLLLSWGYRSKREREVGHWDELDKSPDSYHITSPPLGDML